MRGDGREESRRGGAHGCAERLLIVNPGDLGTALNAESSFEGPVTLPFVNPYQFNELAPDGDVAEVDLGPRSVGLVVGKLTQLGSGPTDAVLALSGVARLGIGFRSGVRQKSVTVRCGKEGFAVRL